MPYALSLRNLKKTYTNGYVALKGLTLDLFRSILDEEEFKDFSDAGIVIQAYLRDSEEDAREMIKWASGRKNPVTFRLVKGAYNEPDSVAFPRKADVDANYLKLARRMLEDVGLEVVEAGDGLEALEAFPIDDPDGRPVPAARAPPHCRQEYPTRAFGDAHADLLGLEPVQPHR